MSDFSVAAADMQDEINRGGLHELWQGLIAGDLEKAAKAYASDAVMHVPQDGRTLVGACRNCRSWPGTARRSGSDRQSRCR